MRRNCTFAVVDCKEESAGTNVQIVMTTQCTLASSRLTELVDSVEGVLDFENTGCREYANPKPESAVLAVDINPHYQRRLVNILSCSFA